MSDFLAARDLVKEYVQGDEKLRASWRNSSNLMPFSFRA